MNDEFFTTNFEGLHRLHELLLTRMLRNCTYYTNFLTRMLKNYADYTNSL